MKLENNFVVKRYSSDLWFEIMKSNLITCRREKPNITFLFYKWKYLASIGFISRLIYQGFIENWTEALMKLTCFSDGVWCTEWSSLSSGKQESEGSKPRSNWKVRTPHKMHQKLQRADSLLVIQYLHSYQTTQLHTTQVSAKPEEHCKLIVDDATCKLVM